MLTPRSPVVSRVAGYLDERFPPVAYTVLVALFFGSAVLVARDISGEAVWPAPTVWLGAPVVWLVFFHLRVFDEHKDHAQDSIAHPDRLLSRGVVTLSLLARLGLLAVVIQIGLSAFIGLPSIVAWAATFAFTVAMRYEFGIGAWLNRHLLVYALTHNPVVGLLAVYGWSCSGVAFVPSLGWYIAAVSLGSLAFELGRKINLPEEEVAGVESYSSVFGRRRAGVLLSLVLFLAAACSSVTVVLVGGDGWGLWSGLALVAIGTGAGLWFARPDQRAKAVELGSSLALLLSLLGMGLAAVG